MKSKKKKRILAAVLCMVMVLTNCVSILAEGGTELDAGAVAAVEAEETTLETKEAEASEIPAEPEQPTEPEAPTEPEQPAAPAEPEKPVEPEQPKAPAEPEQPKAPAETEQPKAPAEPEQTPAQPEVPTEPETPEEPEQAETVFSEAVELKQEFRDSAGHLVQRITAKLPQGAFEAETSAVSMEVEVLNQSLQNHIENIAERNLPEHAFLGDNVFYKVQFKVNGEKAESLQPIELVYEGFNENLKIVDTKKAHVSYYKEDGTTENSLPEITQRDVLVEKFRNEGKSTANIDEYDLSSIAINTATGKYQLEMEVRESAIYGCYVEAYSEAKTYIQKVGESEVQIDVQEGTFDRPTDQVYMTAEALTAEQEEKVEGILLAQAEEKEQTVEDYLVYDINFWADKEHTEKIQPQIPVTLNFKNMNLNKADSDVVTPICVDENAGTLTEMEGTANASEASMTAEHFTLYGVKVTGEKAEEPAQMPTEGEVTVANKNLVEDYLGKHENDWQIVSGEYKSYEETPPVNSIPNKSQEGDKEGLLRIQKNVIPTDVENEFYIYLNMEPVLSWEEVFSQATVWICNNNSVTVDVGQITEGMTATDVAAMKGVGGHASQLVDKDVALDRKEGRKDVISTQPKHEVEIDQIDLLDENGKVVSSIPVEMHYGLSQNSTDSFTILYRAPNTDKFIKVSDIRREGTKLQFPAAAWEQIGGGTDPSDFKLLRGRVKPTEVSDPMGDYIQYLGEAETNNGTVSIDENGKLTWNGFTELERSNNPDDFVIVNGNYYRKNAYQLVYKIRLKTESDGFNSCAKYLGGAQTPDEYSYDTNNTTTVSYETTENPVINGSADFQIPEVRGLLYDIEFTKVDDSEQAKPLPGAKFKVTGGNVDHGYEYNDEKQNAFVETSESDGSVKFRGLPWGTYHLEEIEAPEGYVKTYGGEEITLCYTTNRDKIRQDHGNGHNADQADDIKNMLYTAGIEGKIINPAEGTPPDPETPDEVKHHKYIDYLGDGGNNSQTALTGEEFYRLYLDVKGVPNIKPQPADIVLVLDYSSSMTSGFSGKERWDYVKSSAKLAVETLLPGGSENRVGIVWFDRRANEKNVNLTSDKVALLNNIRSMTTSSGTNYQAAFWNAQDMLATSKDRKKFVIFVTDGEPYDYYSAGKENQNEDYLEHNMTDAKKAAVEAAKLFTGLNGFYAVSVGSDTGTEFLQEKIVGNVNTPVKDVIGANNEAGLRNAFDMFLGSITKQIGNVSITDTLSDYVDFVNRDALDKAALNDQGVITGTKDDPLASSLGLKVHWYQYDEATYNSHTGIMNAEEYPEDYTYEIDPKTKQIKISFGEDCFLVRDKVYTVSFNVKLTEKATPEAMEAANTQGDSLTDYPGNSTSSEKDGLYSNTSAELSYERVTDGVKKPEKVEYEKPVVQPLENTEWDIKKVSKTSKEPLAGAEFTLTPIINNGVGLPTYHGISKKSEASKDPKNGMVEWKKVGENISLKSSKEIEAGTYILRETKAPAGYQLTDREWKVEISRKGAKPIIKLIQNGKETEIQLNQPDSEKEYFILEVENEVVYELPSTGGSGIFQYIMGGTLLMVAAILMLYKMKYKGVLKS